jgi:hypothetical protein
MERPKTKGSHVVVLSSSAVDTRFDNADWVYEFTKELETLETVDSNKKVSNAQTKRYGLTMKPTARSCRRPSPNAPPIDEDFAEEDEKEAGPSHGPRCAKTEEKQG